MKKIAICDDNELQRELLSDMLREYFRRIYQKVDIIEYTRGDTLAADMEEDDLHVAVIFLDIYMPGMDGIETAKKLRALNCHAEIIFLTASEEHAVESYEVHAAGYLVKPLELERLSALLNHIFWTELRRRIEIKCGRQYRYPYVSDIMYIEGNGHKASIYLVDGTQIDTIEKISSLKEKIDDPHFLQCHQSYLVNMNYIADINQDVILSDGTGVPISVRRKTTTIKAYHQFFSNNLDI